MNRCGVRLYNMILPVWLLWILPPVWLIILPANLLIDTAVLFCVLLAQGRRDKRRVMKRMWWRIWWRGFAADAAGVGWLLAALALYEMGGRDAFWLPWLGPVMYNPFAHPIAFLWTLVAVAISGVCIYFFDRKSLGGNAGPDRPGGPCHCPDPGHRHRTLDFFYSGVLKNAAGPEPNRRLLRLKGQWRRLLRCPKTGRPAAAGSWSRRALG